MKILSYNLENFFYYPAHPDYQPPEEKFKSFMKPVAKINAIADIIKELDPDIMCLSEVGGKESLESLNGLHLDNNYNVHVLPGNSDRNIQIGYMTKKNLGFHTKHFSHKHVILDFRYPYEQKHGVEENEHKFSRDVSQLNLYKNENDEKPHGIFLLVHLKSQLDPEGIDNRGILRREAECKELVKIYLKLKEDYGQDVPIYITGDLNGFAQKETCDLEFQHLYAKTDLQDVLEFVGTPEKERTTLYYFNQQKKCIHLQFDYFFMPPSVKDQLDVNNCYIYRYKDSEGNLINTPNFEHEIWQYPSDHFPMVITFKSF